MYLIWSFEHDAWWRPMRRGYIIEVEYAGLYTKDQALLICKAANYGGELNEEMRLASDYGR